MSNNPNNNDTEKYIRLKANLLEDLEKKVGGPLILIDSGSPGLYTFGELSPACELIRSSSKEGDDACEESHTKFVNQTRIEQTHIDKKLDRQFCWANNVMKYVTFPVAVGENDRVFLVGSCLVNPGEPEETTDRVKDEFNKKYKEKSKEIFTDTFTDKLKEAFRTMGENKQFLREFDNVGETSAKLEKLPEKIQFPDLIKDKIRRDANKQLLIFKGVMKERERDELLKLSGEVPYQEAVKTLFQSSLSEIVSRYKDAMTNLNVDFGELEKHELVRRELASLPSFIKDRLEERKCYQEALNCIKEALGQDDEVPEAFKKYEEAGKKYQEDLERFNSPESKAYINPIVHLSITKRYDKAEEDFKKALRQFKKEKADAALQYLKNKLKESPPEDYYKVCRARDEFLKALNAEEWKSMTMKEFNEATEYYKRHKEEPLSQHAESTFVAILHNKVVAHDSDWGRLVKTLVKQFGSRDLLVKQVK